jgi:hypothetical protein
MAGLNPADINDFLRRHETLTNGSSQESYPDYYAHEPRRAPLWAPPLTGHDHLDEADYSHYADDPRYGYNPDDDDDAQSAYTTAPTVTTTRSGTNQSAPSIFSTRTYSTAHSTVPSLYNPNNPNHHHHHHHHPHEQFTPPPRADQILWCEFSPFTACTATFSLADEAGWITHHVQHHLRDTFPAQLMCWFCDDHKPFVVTHAGDSGYANFVERMLHVREHILGDHRLGAGEMRRDFHLVKHARVWGGLSEAGYRRAMAYDETPEAFRLPGTTTTGGGMRGAREEGGRARARWVEEGERERERALYYELEKEKRREERRLRGVGRER